MVQNDMTESQVREILGAPAVTKNVNGHKLCIWQHGDDSISVTFASDKAIHVIDSWAVKDLVNNLKNKN
jgi:hypothetical protein